MFCENVKVKKGCSEVVGWGRGRGGWDAVKWNKWGELLFHRGLLTRLALRGETLITAVSHFSWAVINSPCAEDGWMTITLIKTSQALAGRNGALAKIITPSFFFSFPLFPQRNLRKEKKKAKATKFPEHLWLLKLLPNI